MGLSDEFMRDFKRMQEISDKKIPVSPESEATTVLRQIIAMMATEENWSPGLLDDIAAVLMDHGYAVLDNEGFFKATKKFI